MPLICLLGWRGDCVSLSDWNSGIDGKVIRVTDRHQSGISVICVDLGESPYTNSILS